MASIHNDLRQSCIDEMVLSDYASGSCYVRSEPVLVLSSIVASVFERKKCLDPISHHGKSRGVWNRFSLGTGAVLVTQ